MYDHSQNLESVVNHVIIIFILKHQQLDLKFHKARKRYMNLLEIKAQLSGYSTANFIIIMNLTDLICDVYSVSFFDLKLNQILFGLVSNLKKQSGLFLV